MQGLSCQENVKEWQLCVATQDLNKVVGDAAAIGSLGLVQRHNIVDVIGVAKDSPQLHGDLRRQRNEIVSKVGHLLIRKSLSKYIGGLELFNHSRVIVDAPLSGLVNLAIVKNVGNRNLPLVLFNKVAERNSSLEPDESSGKVEQKVTVALLAENTG